MNVDRRISILSLVICAISVGCEPNVRTDAKEDVSPEVHAVTKATEEASISSVPAEKMSTDGVTVTVNVSKFRNSVGVVQLTLYDKEEDFLKVGSKTARIMRVDVESEAVTCAFPDIRPGRYAIGLMHDENEDGKMASNALRMPKEGIGASRNAKMLFGPPKWEDAVFTVGQDDLTLEIEMKYLGL